MRSPVAPARRRSSGRRRWRPPPASRRIPPACARRIRAGAAVRRRRRPGRLHLPRGSPSPSPRSTDRRRRGICRACRTRRTAAAAVTIGRDAASAGAPLLPSAVIGPPHDPAASRDRLAASLSRPADARASAVVPASAVGLAGPRRRPASRVIASLCRRAPIAARCGVGVGFGLVRRPAASAGGRVAAGSVAGSCATSSNSAPKSPASRIAVAWRGARCVPARSVPASAGMVSVTFIWRLAISFAVSSSAACAFLMMSGSSTSAPSPSGLAAATLILLRSVPDSDAVERRADHVVESLVGWPTGGCGRAPSSRQSALSPAPASPPARRHGRASPAPPAPSPPAPVRSPVRRRAWRP